MTEANLAVIKTRLAALEEGFLRHEEKDEKGFKYAHHMLENALEKLAELERSVSYYEGERLERGRRQRVVDDRDKDTETRVRAIERLIYIAIGGIIILGALIGLVAQRIITLLAGSP